MAAKKRRTATQRQSAKKGGKVPARKSQRSKRGKAGTSKASAATRKALFVKHYIENGRNATQAAITAGYSKKTARQLGSRLLTDVVVADAVKKEAAEAVAIAGLSVERTLIEVARLAYSDPRNLFDAEGNLIPLHQLSDDAAASIASVDVDEITVGELTIGKTKKIKVWDKNAALEKAMKHLGMFEKDNSQKPPGASLEVRFIPSPK